ncbi:spore maturation protein [Proteinivorax tanatarense]|uniref:Spore maturation protein n=1 Tax=Proteinivorax tanatarense TaxID=1260629 RepID=A0AAU7VPM4_9FIRM
MSLVSSVSQWAVPMMVLFVVSYSYYKKVDVFDTFVEGAKEGFETAVKLIPFLVAMLVAIGVFKESGAFEIIIGILEPVLSLAGIPGEILPLAFMRPISGSGALAMTTETLQTYGPDSMLGYMASTIQGSTDTTFYILTVYFGSVGIRRVRYSMSVGLIADIAGFLAAVFICSIFLS